VPSGGALIMREPALTEGVAQTNQILNAILLAIKNQAAKGGSVDLGQIVQGIVADSFNTSYRVG
jgi:hypothetical protein